tara:strand:- start:189 stop:383 length:195 start_codon:yes stop_codon:yes gene_type:complete
MNANSIVIGGGMGPCQHLMCALIVTAILPDANGKTTAEIYKYYRLHRSHPSVCRNWQIDLATVN